KAGTAITLDSGAYELEIKGKPSGVKLIPDKVTLKRGDTVLAKIEWIPKKVEGKAPPKLDLLWKTNWGKDAPISRVSFSHDGSRVVVSRHHGSPNQSRVYDVKSGAVLSILSGWDATFTLDDKHIWGRTINTLRLFDAKTGKLVREFGSHPAE